MTKLNQYICLLLLLLLLGPSALTFSQENYQLKYTFSDSSKHPESKISLQTTFNNKVLAYEYIKNLPDYLQFQGYITASIDTIVEANNVTTIVLYRGKQYKWKKLIVPADHQSIIDQLNLNFSENTIYNPSSLNYSFQQLLLHFENTGYPFAKLSIDSLQLKDDILQGKLLIDKGPLYKIDSINIVGSTKLSKRFIYKYLDIAPKSIFSKKKLDAINKKLEALSYIQQIQPWQINMLSSGAAVQLYLQQKKNNQLNAIIGFLPANQQLGGKLLLTGEANVNLKNAFGNGEAIGLNWQQLQPKSPRLQILYNHPYLFRSSWGLDINFNLFKRDSLFLQVQSQLGGQYAFSPSNSIKLSIQNVSSNMLQVDTTLIKQSKRLPDIADVRLSNLVFEYSLDKTDYILSPKKGVTGKLIIAAGSRKVKKNQTITQIKDINFNYNSLYDTISLNNYQFKLQVDGAKYFTITNNSIIKTGLQGGWLQSDSYFQNELFQIGGYKILRGFDEQSIYTNQFAVATIEYRLLLNRSSYFFTFVDGAVVKQLQSSQFNTYNYISGGLGLNLETKSGIFNLSYAAGKRNDLTFDVKQSKIHIGFSSLF